MIAMDRCSFCGEEIEPGTGTMLVLGDGKTMYFCSHKCLSNYRLGKNPRKVRWTKAYREAKAERQKAKSK